MTHDVSALRDIAVKAVTMAGEFITLERPTQLVVGHKSTSTDAVTQMDTQAEALIVDYLRSVRPQDGFLGEESGESATAHTGVTWVIDPIDGTVNYVYNLPQYAVSVAAVSGPPNPAEWTVLAGAVVNPSSAETWSASRGGGASLNGTALDAPQPTSLDQALIATGFGYCPQQRDRQAAVVRELLPQVRDIRRLGAASLDLCLVADGRLDGYYEQGLGPWDFAAGALIAAEAGRVVSGITEPTPSSTGVVVAGDPVHGQLLKALRTLMG